MKLSCSTSNRDIPAVVPPELPGSVHARYFGIFRIEFVIEEAEQLLACTADIIREIDGAAALLQILIHNECGNDILIIYSRPGADGITDFSWPGTCFV